MNCITDCCEAAGTDLTDHDRVTPAMDLYMGGAQWHAWWVRWCAVGVYGGVGAVHTSIYESVALGMVQ